MMKKILVTLVLAVAGMMTVTAQQMDGDCSADATDSR